MGIHPRGRKCKNIFNWDERHCPSVPLNSPRVYSGSTDLEIWVWEPWAQSVHPMVNRQKQPCDRCEGRDVWRDLMTASCLQNRDKVVLLALKCQRVTYHQKVLACFANDVSLSDIVHWFKTSLFWDRVCIAKGNLELLAIPLHHIPHLAFTLPAPVLSNAEELYLYTHTKYTFIFDWFVSDCQVTLEGILCSLPILPGQIYIQR